MRKLLAILIAWCVSAVLCRGQDIHFSEFYASALNLNPALAGMFQGDLRASISYRDQYRAVADPYQTFSAAADWKQPSLLGSKHALGAGLLVNADVAGDADFGAYHAGFAFALHFALSPKLRLSIAGMPVLCTSFINEDKLRFGDQWQGGRYDEDSYTAEPMGLSWPAYFSLAAGTQLSYQYAGPRGQVSAGLGVYNINQPDMSLYRDGAELPRRYSLHGMWRFRLAPGADAVPAAKLLVQGPHTEAQIGAQIYSYLRGYSISSISYGAGFRVLDRDALAVNAGFAMGAAYMGINYDINLSELSKASNSRGAFEIHCIVYIDKSKFKKKPEVISCPGTF
jgi:type IX secretion system PorP/SprF family membrane protein